MHNFKRTLSTFGLFITFMALGATVSYGQTTKGQQTPTTANVNVVNTAQVRDADNPARQPYQNGFFLVGVNAIQDSWLLATVPAGKRLVIENVAVSGVTPTGQRMFVSLSTGVNNLALRHPLLVSAQGTNEDGEAEFVISQQVRLYADPGTAVTLHLKRSSTTGLAAITFATISGYLVDVQ